MQDWKPHPTHLEERPPVLRTPPPPPPTHQYAGQSNPKSQQAPSRSGSAHARAGIGLVRPAHCVASRLVRVGSGLAPQLVERMGQGGGMMG